VGLFRLLRLCCLIVLPALAFGLAGGAVSAEMAGAVAVVYPDVGEPYRAVFLKIVEGIESRLRSRVVAIPVGARPTAQELGEDLRRQDVRVVVALGRQGLTAANGLDQKYPVVAGAVFNVPEGDNRPMAVHSLAPDPGLLFQRLKSFLPEVKRVFVVYDPASSAWQIRLARDAAKAQGLELVVTEVSDLKAAARAYRSIFEMVDPHRDAIWLLQDPMGAEESTVLPFVLEEGWTRSLPVFSSNLAHVRRGALFTLYPDNEELGRRLGTTALSLLAGGGQTGVAPLREVLLAVNQRSAHHLGININPRQQGIDLILPAQ
jgi:ABC transporter substrate binding protein